ncbi:MAG: hypothetical protein QM627_01420 [Luteolibacter sp.]
MPGPASEPEKYTIDDMMDRLQPPSDESSNAQGEIVTRPDGTQVIRVKRRKRRSHQPHKEKEAKSLRSSILLFATGAVVLFALILTVLGFVIYANSAPFRNALTAKIATYTGAEVTLNQFRVNPTGANANLAKFLWPENQPLHSATLRGIASDLSPASFFGKGLRGSEITIQRADIRFRRSDSPPAGNPDIASPLSFERCHFKTLTLQFGEAASLDNSEASYTPRNLKGNAEIRLRKGLLKSPAWPGVKLDRASLEAYGGKWNISAYCEPSQDRFGSLVLSGPLHPWHQDQESVLTVKTEAFPLSDLIGTPFDRLISGKIDTTATPTSNFLILQPNAESPAKLSLEWQGSPNAPLQLSGFPFLSTLSHALDDRNFENLALTHEVSGSLQRDSETIALRNFRAHTPRHAALRGDLSLNRRTKALSGTVFVGLPDSIIRLTRGFGPHFGELSEGYRWIEVTIGGTVDAPTDNLEALLRSPASPRSLAPSSEQKIPTFEELTTPGN